jgi:hypothetical protein
MPRPVKPPIPVLSATLTLPDYVRVARYPGARLAIGAVFTPVLTKYSESFSRAADLDRRRPYPPAWRLDHLVTNVTPKLEISGQCRDGI